MSQWLNSLKFYLKQHEEIRIRVALLSELEQVWYRLWDYPLGKLVYNAASLGSIETTTNAFIKSLKPDEWLELISQYRLVFASYEGNEAESFKTPDRIPDIMKRIREEWINSERSFGEYLLCRLEVESPGECLNGYDFSCDGRRVNPTRFN